jgi:hypothetical protein
LVTIWVPSPNQLRLICLAGKSRLSRSGARQRPLSWPGGAPSSPLALAARPAARPCSRISAALSYIRIERAAGVTLIEGQLPDSKMLALKLDPGAYRLISWQRTCDPNCGNLDPPSTRCARPFTMRQREPLEATVRVNLREAARSGPRPCQ